MAVIYSIIESPTHPDYSRLYQRLGLQHVRLSSQRKAISQLKRQPPDWVVAEYFYGFGNNYAGVNVSNLDVFLHSQRKYAPNARIIVLASPRDWPHADKLTALFDIHAVLRAPADESSLADILSADT